MPANTKNTKIDFKKKYPKLYKPSAKEPMIVEVPEMNFFMIDGEGDPNSAQEYKDALEALYGVAYALKMKVIKKKTPSKDYVVPPLEGFWYIDNMEEWSMDEKNKWKWTMMIMIPDFVKEDQIKKALEIIKETKNPKSLPKIYIKKYNEGKVAQIMHIGPYNDEPPTVEKLHKYIEDQGYIIDGLHHEIYLSDPRKAKPEKMKTVIRQPIRKNK
ncbi:MAG: hypothetical protein GY870_15805 [archaeon]|nr:hypothetical protein [archaeon]